MLSSILYGLGSVFGGGQPSLGSFVAERNSPRSIGQGQSGLSNPMPFLQNLAADMSRSQREQDLYNIMPAQQAAQIINQNRQMALAEQENARRQKQQSALEDFAKRYGTTTYGGFAGNVEVPNVQSGSGSALAELSAITGDPSYLAKYLMSTDPAISGGNTPAPMRIASKMFELEQAMNNPNLPENERYLAEREYNLLGQAAKTYGFDRGMQASPLGGYESVFGGIPPIEMDSMGNLSSLDMGGTSPSSPLRPDQYPADPIAANNAARQAQAANIASGGRSPVGMQAIEGYGQAAADIAAQKKAAETQAQKDVELAMNPQIEAAVKEIGAQAQAIGKERGEAEASLAIMEAQYPRLQELVGELSDLGQKATYTGAGRVVDVARREAGLEPRESSIAREEYISKVNNEILPLLRATFGAQFTEREGQRLIQTLGAPNVSPQEKDAVLRSFIQQKEAQIKSLSRQVGREPNLPASQQQNNVIRWEDLP